RQLPYQNTKAPDRQTSPDHRLQKASWNIWKTPDRCSAQFLISSKFLSYQLSFSHVLSAPSALRSFSILPRRRGMFNPLTQAGIQSGTPCFAIGDTGKRDWGRTPFAKVYVPNHIAFNASSVASRFSL